MIKAGIIGATGYAGVELLRILLTHPNVTIAAISSESFKGKDAAAVYPNLAKRFEMILCDQDEVADKCDVVFASLPHGLSEKIAARCMEKGAVLIDLGADFRLTDGEQYEKWYGLKFNDTTLHEKAVYGLCEINRDRIRNTDIIGNPGCYPTSISLGLYPAIKKGLVALDNIIIDAKSGVTGAGRSLTQNTHYPECNENFAPYKVASHRHTPEIEQTLSLIADQKVSVTFVPHLLPVNRGILSTMYCRKLTDMSLADVHKLYTDIYKNERFVRVLPLGSIVQLKDVKYSNYCDISLHEDKHTNTLIVAATIDNMVKGAAGQAIQNMNIRFHLPEDTGLDMIPPAF